MRIISFTGLLLWFCWATTALAQPGTKSEKTGADTSSYYFLEIEKLIARGGSIRAVAELEHLKIQVPKSYACHRLLAKAYLTLQQYDSAKANLSKLQTLKTKKPDPFTLFYLGYAQYRLGETAQATETLHRFEASRPPFNADIWAEARRIKTELSQGNPLKISPERFIMDSTFEFPNSAYADFSPIVVGDTAFIFSSLRKDSLVTLTPGQPNFNTVQLFHYKIRPDGKFDELSVIRQLNKAGYHCGNGSFSKDGKRFFFSRCVDGANGQPKCAVYEAEVKADGSFHHVRKLNDRINKRKYSSSQPFFATLSVNGAGQDVLFFVSNRKSGFGKNDIWYSLYNRKKKRFGAAMNCGMVVNSPGNDESPYLSAKGDQFFFSSDGFLGFGGKDIFVASASGLVLKDRLLMPPPINSSGDDAHFFLQPGGQSGYLSSNRKGANLLDEKYCCPDIFRFVVPRPPPQKPEPEPPVVASLDTAPTLPLPVAAESQIEEEKVPDVSVPTIETAKNASFHAQSTEKERKSPDAQAQKRPVRKIYFAKNSARLTPQSRKMLNTLLTEIRKEKPAVVYVKGFADHTGSQVLNQKLAANRAAAVLRYCKAKKLKTKFTRATANLAEATRTNDLDMLSLDRYVEVWWKK